MGTVPHHPLNGELALGFCTDSLRTLESSVVGLDDVGTLTSIDPVLSDGGVFDRDPSFFELCITLLTKHFVLFDISFSIEEELQ